MPEPTDPANARLALRRLLRNLVLHRPDVTPSELDTFDGVLSWLDSDEVADYEQVVAALDARPRFARTVIDPDHEDGRTVYYVLDIGKVDQHGDTYAPTVARAEDFITAKALNRLLNDHPDEWEAALAATEEPF